MQAIVDFLSGIGDAIISVFDFIIAFFKDFISFLRLLAGVPEIIENFLFWFPVDLLPFVLLLFGVIILYKILGREG